MRRFEYQDDKSAKFWEIQQVETNLTLRWGRIGTAGQSQTKQFADVARAGAALAKLIVEKTGKGYAEVEMGASGVALPEQAPSASSLATGAVDVGPASAQAAPPETVDQRIERVFDTILNEIIAGELDPGNDWLGSARIRDDYAISAAAADQVNRNLAHAGLVKEWYSVLVEGARDIAIALARDTRSASDHGSATGVASPPAQAPSGTVPPWLAQGEPLRLGDRFDRTRQLARERPVDDNFSGDNLWKQRGMVSTLLLEHGIDAVRWLAPGAVHGHAGDALTRIGTPEALDALARVASTNEAALMRFALAVERWPVAAAAALAHLLSGTSKDEHLLTPFLVELLRQDATLESQLHSWLAPEGNRVLERLRARLAPPNLARAEELPDVLVNPPWLGAKKKPFASLQLPTLSLPVALYWEEGEKDQILNLSSRQRNAYQEASRSPEKMAAQLGFPYEEGAREQQADFTAARDAIAQGDAAALIAAWRSLLAWRYDTGYYTVFDARAAAHLPPHLGVPLWNVAASEAYSCYCIEFAAATWGLDAFPGVAARISAAPSEHLRFGMRYGAVELALTAARAFATLKTLRALGREWLERYPEHAACGLIGPALGKAGQTRDCAAASLRHLASIGHTALLESVAARYGKPEVLTALHAMLDENPLDRFPNKRASMPDFWDPTGWNRPVLHNGKALPDAALEVIGTMLTFPTNEGTYAGLDQLKAACTQDSLADFAWDCFSAWLLAGAPAKASWALASLGVFGTDDTSRKLTAYIRAWPGEAAHARAVSGLDVLAAIGSDVALMLLNGIAQKIKFKALQDRAREKITAVAEARGLTPEELDDRLAPDLGLDEAGSMILDFGPRAFQVGFDEALKPYVREWLGGSGTSNKPGARLVDLPKPKQTDDPELAKAATERFKLLKKDVRTIASQQVRRLETAMCTRRRWTPSVFAVFIANHPLVRHLARRLVWGVYLMPLDPAADEAEPEAGVANYGGELQGCFRVSEDGQYTDANDDPYSLPEGVQVKVGLPHALELPPDHAAAFGQLLADYELLQPFVQLGRDTYTLTDDEREAQELDRWCGLKVPAGTVLGLTNFGWRRGPARDGGGIWTFEKPLGDGRMFELGIAPGLAVGMMELLEEQSLGEITLSGAARSGRGSALATFSTLDAIAASELIRDMERLRP